VVADLILWSHALAAVLFGLLALGQVRGGTPGLPRGPFVAALAATLLWALAVAGIGADDVAARIAEGGRDLAWLGFMAALARVAAVGRRRGALLALYGVVALVVGSAVTLALAEAVVAPDHAEVAPLLQSGRLVLGMVVAVAALVLVHHLFVAAGARARGGAGLALAAVALLWCVDLALYAAAWATGRPVPELVAARGVAVALVAPLLAVAVHRSGEWTLQLSRTVAWHTLTALGLALYVGAMLLLTQVVGWAGGEHARVAQTAFVFGSTTALVTIVSTPWLRAWAKVKLAKHLFRHRYDYRGEWLRFTDTLGQPGEGAPPLERRVAKAMADLTDSPAALLLVPGPLGLEPGGGWNWEGGAGEGAGADGADALASFLVWTGRIVALDDVRAGTVEAAELAAVPPWMAARGDAWALVPLLHVGVLAGAVLLARPPVDRALDWEDFDLLRAAGCQAASFLAEHRAHLALAEAQRFEEFNRRFAFILHDIKNLVSQLSLTARNAERHADNPAFRRDMVATLTESADRMNALLAKLSQQHRAAGPDLAPVAVGAVVERVVAARRGAHPMVWEGAGDLHAQAEPARLEQLLGHLVQNAVEASAPATPVTVRIGEADGRVAIDVVDTGCGMSAAFVRDQLFRPFASSKPGGFGIGAFEARQLATAMGGGIEVASREGEGTRFRVLLQPAAAPAREERAAPVTGRAARTAPRPGDHTRRRARA
jgi:putative PEP-CTERM system histidine kinase